jgi:beta-keto acid cleavage enzyme
MLRRWAPLESPPFVERGRVKPPFFVQMVFGILGGIGPDLDNLAFMKRTAALLFTAIGKWCFAVPPVVAFLTRITTKPSIAAPTG